MGKTTVLRSVEKDLKSGRAVWIESRTLVVPIYVDGLVLERPLAPESLWTLIAKCIAHEFDGHDWSFSSSISFSEFVEGCRKILKCSELVPRFIILIDEVENILVHEWAGAFFANWRALLTNYPDISGYFGAVFAGARELEALQHDVGSPLMDVLEWKSLRSLSLADASRLIREPCDLKVDDELVDGLYYATGGHPMILQYVLQKIVDRGEGVTKESCHDAIRDFARSRAWQFSDWWSKYCSENARRVYRGLPAIERRPVRDIVQELGGFSAAKAIENLEHVGIAEIDDVGNHIWRRGSMFSEWQTQHGVSDGQIAIDENLARLIGAISMDLKKKYVSSWCIYAQDIPNYSGAVSEMRDLITLVLHELAPDAAVQSQADFAFERDQTKPTRRQRVRYILGASAKEQVKSLASDDSLLDSMASQLASVVSGAYANASALTHTIATRPLAYSALKQGESIIAQLLASRVA